MTRIAFFLLLVCVSQARAIEFDLMPAQVLSGHYDESVFHHLETGGRPPIAINGDTVAVVWEDNSSGTNSVYFTSKRLSDKKFRQAINLSAKAFAYVPVISAYKEGFIVAWEQDDTCFLKYVDKAGAVKATTSLGKDQDRQIALDYHGGELVAAWVHGNFQQSDIATAEIVYDGRLRVRGRRVVDADTEKTLKAFPSILQSGNNHVVSWQDRRSGTNVIRYAYSSDGGAYSKQGAISETVSKSAYYGRGSGVMRASLARTGKDEVIALWLDKRASRSGYEVYASFSGNNGRTFGENHIVQDHFGDQFPQWNASVISDDSDRLIAIWNDPRDGEDLQDLYFSWYEDGAWSDDTNIEISDELSDQTSPYAAIDKNGDIHVVWIDILDGRSSVNYTFMDVK